MYFVGIRVDKFMRREISHAQGGRRQKILDVDAGGKKKVKNVLSV